MSASFIFVKFNKILQMAFYVVRIFQIAASLSAKVFVIRSFVVTYSHICGARQSEISLYGRASDESKRLRSPLALLLCYDFHLHA